MLEIKNNGSFLPLGHTKTLRCLSEVSDLSEYVITRKRDGVRAFLDFSNKVFIGRRGILPNLNLFAQQVIEQLPQSVLRYYQGLDGELVANIDEDNLGFVTGHCNAKNPIKNLHFKVFDGLIKSYNYGYEARLTELGCFLPNQSKISLIEKAPPKIAKLRVSTTKWCQKHWEGLILRTKNNKFRPGRQETILKYKPRELLIASQRTFLRYYISDKVENSISRVEFYHPTCRGKILSVSTGFKLEDRVRLFSFFTRDKQFGKFYMKLAVETRALDCTTLHRKTINASFLSLCSGEWVNSTKEVEIANG